MVVSYTVIDGEIVGETRDGVYKSYVLDSNGSVIAIVDEAGVVTDTFEYWPYGELRSRTGTTPTPFQYKGGLGYYTDPTGHVYVRARNLQPRTASWISVDPLWPSEPAYTYCRNNPTTASDPSGMAGVSQFLPGPHPKAAPPRRPPGSPAGNASCADWNRFIYEYCNRCHPGYPEWLFRPPPADCALACSELASWYYDNCKSRRAPHVPGVTEDWMPNRKPNEGRRAEIVPIPRVTWWPPGPCRDVEPVGNPEYDSGYYGCMRNARTPAERDACREWARWRHDMRRGIIIRIGL